MDKIKYASIKFGPAMYTVFRNIPNTAWNALCEFVDNSIQASLDSSQTFNNNISIDISRESISISDSGPGFTEDQLSTGLEPARIPENQSQLNEFGMGMKLAALYFGDRYVICTSPGNGLKYKVEFDLANVVENNLTQIQIKQEPYQGESFTTLTIDKLSQDTQINVDLELGQIRERLSEVYSVLIERNQFQININGQGLMVRSKTVLNAPWYDNSNGPDIEWLEHFDIKNGEFGISGYVGLLDPMSNTNRGFKLIRRGRVVAGIQENVKPHTIFGSPGSFLSKRLFGYMELHGFGISFNKTELLSKNELDELYILLKQELNSKKNSILKQGSSFRIGKKTSMSNGTNPPLNISPKISIDPSTQLKSDNANSKSITLVIDSCKMEITQGTSVGKFIQSEYPGLILRSDFFSQTPTRTKVISVIQTFSSNTDISLDQITIVKLIDLLWPLLK